MKYFFIILSEFLILVDAGVKNNKIFPNLPLGEYRVNIIATQPCNINQRSRVQYNFYLYKTSRTTTEIRGNITNIDRTFDDTLYFRGTMAIKDKIGTWQHNAYIYQSPRAYSITKTLLGAEFQKFLNSFGVNDTSHKSIPPGIYLTNGYDVSNYPANTNLPRQIFYGTYKLNFNYTETNGDPVGCFILIAEIKRPWETD